MNPSYNQNIGLVLSGGGIRGIAHIGAIKALAEHHIHPEIVSGSSAGAVVGALYCMGYSPEQMMEFFTVTPLFRLNKFAFSKPGFIDTDKFYSDFKKYFKEDRFEELEKQLYVTTVDLCHGNIRVFSEGHLIRPLLASSAFPGLFSPVSIDNILFGDGGILDNFPTSPIKRKCDRIIGIYASPLGSIDPPKLKHSVSVLERAIRINYSKRSRKKFADCALMISPPELSDYGLLDIGKMNEIFKIGYDSAIAALKGSKDLKPLQRSPKN